MDIAREKGIKDLEMGAEGSSVRRVRVAVT
jgi:hypothetical protein